MFWGKTMGQEMAEPVWHCCSINPAGAAGSHYFAGCYLAQAKVSWHFVTSPEAQLLEKLCQGPECINGTELFWQASHGFSNPQPLLRGSTTSYTLPKLRCRCAYLCLQLWYSNAWLCALLSWLDPDLWTKFLVWCWTCLFTMELPNDCEIVYDSLYQGWSRLVFLASYWTYPVTTNLTCSWCPLLLTSKELRLETDWDSTRCKA